jgi:hypothetical protein
MTTRITIDFDETTVTVHVTDDLGRAETRKMRRYPHPESHQYVKFVDGLDMMMDHPNTQRDQKV